jgi:S-DNA-T family DNA segregation ATPase FtsK/SpoIIIE
MATKDEKRSPSAGKNGKKGGRRASRPKISLDINPRLQRDTLAVAMAVLTLATFMGVYFDGAGPVGHWLDGVLASLFGFGRYLVPVLLAYGAGGLAFPERFRTPLTTKLGAILFFGAALALLNVTHLQTADAMREAERLAEAGGYFGLMLGYPAVSALGFWAGLAAVTGILLLALGLTFNASVADLMRHLEFLRRIPVPRIKLPERTPRTPESSGFSLREAPETTDVAASISSAAQTASSEPAFPPVPVPTDPGDPKQQMNIIAAATAAKAKRVAKRLAALPVDLLEVRHSKAQGGDTTARQFTIKKTLDNFGIPVEMGDISVGPTVTQYTLKPADGIKLSRLTGLSNDLALSLAAHPIRIEAPIPGKSLVGIEVPNEAIAMVSIRDLIDSKEFKERKSDLTFVLGKDVAGKPWVADLARMPHLLVAGATGSGKTVCLNAIIVSLLYANSPETLRLILVDPKRVELPIYNGIPHLLTPAITEVPKVINSLKWAIGEMDRRFEVLAKAGCRDIGSYNERSAEKMPFIVIVVDELADLMVAAAAEVEAGIIRLAQMARAVGIHLIVATQRPSVDVITGLIKANIPARIAFSVASGTDSRTILDTLGAEKLVGRGDSLFQTAELSRPKRIQCCFVADREIRKVVDFITSQLEEPVQYNEAVTSKGGKADAAGGSSMDDDDELLEEARDTVIRAGKASASFLQRRLKVGYARAARLLDLLEERGIIGPGDGAKPREVLVNAIHDVDGAHITLPPGDEENV